MSAVKGAGKPVFFASPSEFGSWLERHHASESELLVGYYKKDSGIPSITWPESVDEALCYGWIDGVRKRIDDISYTIRFTPRKKGSIWSNVNIGRVKALTEEGRMREHGLKAFEGRKEEKSGIYSFEQEQDSELDAASEEQLRANRAAWDFFQAQPASYRKTAIWKIVSAKKEETKRKRLAELIDCSEKGQRIPSLTWTAKPK